jgi:membrane protein YdbS with pleckstrin-like domain
MVKKKLHPGAKWLFRINSYISMLVLIVLTIWVFISLLSGLGISYWTSALFYLIIIIFVGEIYTRLSYKNWFYEFSGNSLKTERGIIWKKYSNIPYERVQNVDIHRGILARMLGFSAVMIQTAGYSAVGRYGKGSVEGSLPAVSVDEAEKIREFLMGKISGKKGQGM